MYKEENEQEESVKQNGTHGSYITVYIVHTYVMYICTYLHTYMRIRNQNVHMYDVVDDDRPVMSSVKSRKEKSRKLSF